MIVRLMPLGCKIPNLALMKISAWHKLKGDIVSLDHPNPDKVYFSSPFSSFEEKNYSGMFPNAETEFGGYGFNNSKLPDEIEHLMPDYSIFECDHSMGYTTRGCTRKCKKPPCIVPIMEGELQRNSPIEEFHDLRHDTVELLDNNILADKSWFFKNTDYLIEHDLKLIEHGLDIRYVDLEIAERLSELKFAKSKIHFALDTMFDIAPALEILSQGGIRPYRLMFYIYEKDDFESLFKRAQYLIGLKCDPYVMLDVNATKEIRRFYRYINRRIYRSAPYKDYNPNIKNRRK